MRCANIVVCLVKFYPHPKRVGGIRGYLHFNLKFNWKILFSPKEKPLKKHRSAKETCVS